MTAYIIDTETTTNDRERAEVIELAYTTLHPNLIADPQTAVLRYKPSRNIDWGALATHHILPGELHNEPLSTTAVLPSDARYIIGHNVDFDWEVLGKPPVKRIDTLALARYLWPDLDSHKLGAVVYYLMGANPATKALLRDSHSAGADVNSCRIILEAVLDERPHIQSIEALWAFSEDARIPRIMTFGKYKGQNVADVDRGWVKWYRGQADTDPYLLEAFRRLGR